MGMTSISSSRLSITTSSLGPLLHPRSASFSSVASEAARYPQKGPFAPTDRFEERHNGVVPGSKDEKEMLALLGFKSMEELVRSTVPSSILSAGFESGEGMGVGEGMSETQATEELRRMAELNDWNKTRSFIGQGYYGTITPPRDDETNARESGMVH